MDNFTSYTDKAVRMVMEYAPKLALAILVVVIGFWFIKRIVNLIAKGISKANLTPEITTFVRSIIDILLKVLLLFSVAEIVGIETASFVAVLAAAGFAVGLALQGSLGNFAAGIIILIFRPYRVGDWVEIQDKFGKVEDIQIFNTIVKTPGRKVLIIPNGQVIDGIVTNYSHQGFIRMELNVTIPYSENFPRIKELLMDELGGIDKILRDPEPEIGIEGFDSHNIVLSVRPYVEPDDFWEVTFETHARIKSAFHKHNVQVAYSEGVEMGKIGG